MLVEIHIDDYVFDVVERSATEFTAVAGDEKSGEALFIKMILTEHLLLHFRGLLSPELFDRLSHLKYDGRGLMEFFLEWDNARQGIAGYNMEMDAAGKIESITTPVGKMDPVDSAWHTPEDFEEMIKDEAELRKKKKD